MKDIGLQSGEGARWKEAFAADALLAFKVKCGPGPHSTATVAAVLWPEQHREFLEKDGMAVRRMIKNLGCWWMMGGGWMIP